jgi:hypothetical protein
MPISIWSEKIRSLQVILEDLKFLFTFTCVYHVKDPLATGISSSDKMHKMILKVANQTLRFHSRKIDVFLNFLGQVEYFLIDTTDVNPHISTISHLRYTHRRIDAGHKMVVELSCLENTITDIFFDLVKEFGEAIRSLIIGNYNSIPRSLRWILESTIFWASMQDESRDSTEAFDDYCRHLPISKTKFKYLRGELRQVNYELLVQRLSLKDEWHVSFRDIVSKIGVIKTNSNFFKKVRDFSFDKKIHSLYHHFSTYEHITFETLSEIDDSLRSDFASYMNYRYNREAFLPLLSYMWITLDLVLSIMVLTIAKFYGYKTGKRFIRRLEVFPGNSNVSYFIKLCNSNRIKRKLPIFLDVVLG